MAGDVSLHEIPGIGQTRAAALRQAGYTCGMDIATASVDALAEIPQISQLATRCIRPLAREYCGFADTALRQLAIAVDADREQVTEQYAALAPTLVPPEAALDTLQRLHASNTPHAVVQCSAYTLRDRHYLLQAGFETLDDIAAASVTALTAVQYIGSTRAQRIKNTAIQVLTETTDTPPDDHAVPTASVVDADTVDSNVSELTGDLTIPDQQQVLTQKVPPALRKRKQWLLWKATEDGRKVPRAPWATTSPEQYVSAMNATYWTSFQTAVEWQSKLPRGFHLAFTLTLEDDIVFFDLDDVIVDGTLTPVAQSLITDAGSYAAVSTSGTGVHILATGTLPDGVTALTGQLAAGADQTVEVYDHDRFIAITGAHIPDTPMELLTADALLTHLEREFATVNTNTPKQAPDTPPRSRDAVHAIDTTHDIQDIFNAIAQTRPSDIRLRSTQTEQRGDGTYSYDPSWTHSDSGTRLGVLDEVWIYRAGMIALDALQVVALEEGIITTETDYPEGEAFWAAVDALRDRGAHIPTYIPDKTATDVATATSKAESESRTQ